MTQIRLIYLISCLNQANQGNLRSIQVLKHTLCQVIIRAGMEFVKGWLLFLPDPLS